MQLSALIASKRPILRRTSSFTVASWPLLVTSAGRLPNMSSRIGSLVVCTKAFDLSYKSSANCLTIRTLSLSSQIGPSLSQKLTQQSQTPEKTCIGTIHRKSTHFSWSPKCTSSQDSAAWNCRLSEWLRLSCHTVSLSFSDLELSYYQPNVSSIAYSRDSAPPDPIGSTDEINMATNASENHSSRGRLGSNHLRSFISDIWFKCYVDVHCSPYWP